MALYANRKKKIALKAFTLAQSTVEKNAYERAMFAVKHAMSF